MNISISIVIVNWNTGSLLQACCQSIEDSDLNHVQLQEVIVVDNASTDDSAKGVVGHTLPLQLLMNQENQGFAFACNQGAKLATGELILFLNPDVRLYKQTLESTVAFMSSLESVEIGICGVRLEDAEGNYTTSVSHFPSALGVVRSALGFRPPRAEELLSRGNQPNVSVEVDQVIGAYFLIRSKLFRQLGGFDERFFVYFEEVDLSVRARSAGWRSACLPGVAAFHLGGGSSQQIKARRLFYFLRSRLLYSGKHFSWAGLSYVVFATLCIEVCTRSILAVFQCSWQRLCETWCAYGMLFRWLPQWLFGVRR